MFTKLFTYNNSEVILCMDGVEWVCVWGGGGGGGGGGEMFNLCCH